MPKILRENIRRHEMPWEYGCGRLKRIYIRAAFKLLWYPLNVMGKWIYFLPGIIVMYLSGSGGGMQL